MQRVFALQVLQRFTCACANKFFFCRAQLYIIILKLQWDQIWAVHQTLKMWSGNGIAAIHLS